MNCVLEFLNKHGKTNDGKLYRGQINYHNGVARFIGTPYSMGKNHTYVLKEARLLKITKHHYNEIILTGTMNDKKCWWRVRVR